MPDVLVVEDEAPVAAMLVDMVELNPGYAVIACADDLDSSLRAAWSASVDIAFVDINLANNSSGYSVAAELSRMGIRCIFVTGQVPPLPLPEFAVGCLQKPLTSAAVAEALNAASDKGGGITVQATDSAFQRY